MSKSFRPIIALFLFFISCEPKVEQGKEVIPKTFENAAVVSAHPLATEIGVDILKSGGNVFDAAVAVHFALAVVYPYAGNLGGGGFAVFFDSLGQSGTLDFREKAPLASSRNMYLDFSGNVIPNLSTKGALAVGVPGSVKGMWELHKKYGLKPWKELIQPSIEIAQSGWELTEHASFFLNKYSDDINNVNEGRTYLTIKDNWEKGDSLRNEPLAQTLSMISNQGPDGFYKGDIADAIVSTMERFGGIISKEDLEMYEPKWRDPLIGNYKGYQVISMPPPSSGGWALISLLKMVEDYPIVNWGKWDSRTINTLCEIEKRVYADRSKYLGDADFFPVPLENLLKDEYLKKRIQNININKATPSDSISFGFMPGFEGEETTHFSIIDKSGNAISITTTLNNPYGSKLIVEGAGFLLNNEMDDFSIKPGYPNSFGLIGGEANSIESGKRMLSSMTPTIITKDNEVFLVLGSPGGSTIITSVFQNILNVIDFGYNMQESVNLPRFHHQWLPDLMYYEKGFFKNVDSLQFVKTGQNLQQRSPIGRVDAILVNSNGQLECGADPRRDDFADGY